MQVNSFQNISKIKNIQNFNGMREVADIDTIRSFKKRTEKLGDVYIARRNGKILVPHKVSLVKCKLSKKDDSESKILYGLFEDGYEKSSSLEDIDKKELGLIETKRKIIDGGDLYFLTKRELDSAKAMADVYSEAMKVMHFISYGKGEYRGIGSKLMDVVVQKGAQMNTNGNTFLFAKNLLPEKYYKHSLECVTRDMESMPTPFYHAYGYRADDKTNALLDKRKWVDGITMHIPLASRKPLLARISSELGHIKL